LHQLRYVLAVADTGNFTRAAERCRITQPTLSQQLMKLEREFGQKLFHRLARRAVPTETGLAFLEHARHIVAEVDDAARELRDPQAARCITVGATPTVAPYLLPRLLKRCRAFHPKLEVQIRENFRGPLMRAVIEGELDLAITSLPVADRRISVEPIFTDPLVLVVGKNHPLASRPRVTPKDLSGQTFVMMGDGSTLAQQIERFFGDRYFELRVAHRCAQVATLKSLVALGAGLSILPKMARAPGDEKSLVYKPLAGRTPVREIGVLRHMQRYQSRGAEQFLAVLRKTAASLQQLDE
ncbi:MAG: LysR family transcriptional regulator, partial [Verrucomicrobiota bacterium]|nr:LysR family transcriptional regulator [Verrucomicrobiota bacterium]